MEKNKNILHFAILINKSFYLILPKIYPNKLHEESASFKNHTQGNLS
jgi:hypothetical protein